MNSSEFKYRLLTAIILIFCIAGMVFYLPLTPFAFLSAAILSIAAWEWSFLSGYSSLIARGLYLGIFWMGLILIQGLSSLWFASLSILMSVSLIAYISRLLTSVTLPRYSSLYLASLGGTALTLCWQSLQLLKGQPAYLWLGLLVVWLTDTLAYFIGRTYGRHLLAPLISPNKTWEGLIGGILGASLIGLILLKIYSIWVDSLLPNYYSSTTKLMLAFSLLSYTATVSVAGDLFESLAKRQRQVKDSGWILPGHGGLLDRLDSLIMALPVWATTPILCSHLFLLS